MKGSAGAEGSGSYTMRERPLWDVLFGTARITRRYPEAYGIENEAPQSWAAQLVWPLARERRD